MSLRRVGPALLLWALVCALPLLADSNARIVRLSYVDGTVDVDRRSGERFERAVLNMPVVQGMRLATRDNSSAEVEFEDGSTLRLAPSSSVEFQELALRGSGERVSVIEMLDGTAYFDLNNKKEDFTVRAGSQELTLPKAARFRILREGSELKVGVFKGGVDVRTLRGSVRVKKNETLSLNLNDPERYYLADGVNEDEYDTWNRQRDQYRETYASTQHASYSSLYNYGWSDLNYFGTFFSYPGYGSLWRPYNVGTYWDPFADGAWMYYPGYGWVWVSAYPWGWTPYRYGSWLFVPGYGWCWRPAHSWYSWYAVPVIYHAPSGYIAPRPPGTHNGPHVVVVGNGPLQTVHDPRYGKWLHNADTGPHPQDKAQIGPVSPLPTRVGRRGQTEPVATSPTIAPAAPTPAPTVAAPPPASHHGQQGMEGRDSGSSKGPEPAQPAAPPVMTPTPAAPTPLPQRQSPKRHEAPAVVPGPAPSAPPAAPAASPSTSTQPSSSSQRSSGGGSTKSGGSQSSKSTTRK